MRRYRGGCHRDGIPWSRGRARKPKDGTVTSPSVERVEAVDRKLDGSDGLVMECEKRRWGKGGLAGRRFVGVVSRLTEHCDSSTFYTSIDFQPPFSESFFHLKFHQDLTTSLILHNSWRVWTSLQGSSMILLPQIYFSSRYGPSTWIEVRIARISRVVGELSN